MLMIELAREWIFGTRHWPAGFVSSDLDLRFSILVVAIVAVLVLLTRQ